MKLVYKAENGTAASAKLWAERLKEMSRRRQYWDLGPIPLCLITGHWEDTGENATREDVERALNSLNEHLESSPQDHLKMKAFWMAHWLDYEEHGIEDQTFEEALYDRFTSLNNLRIPEQEQELRSLSALVKMRQLAWLNNNGAAGLVKEQSMAKWTSEKKILATRSEILESFTITERRRRDYPRSEYWLARSNWLIDLYNSLVANSN